MENIIYVAVDKETGEVISGVHGQYAYGRTQDLNRSMVYALRYTAKRKGVKAKELYNIVEIDVDRYIDFTDDAVGESNG